MKSTTRDLIWLTVVVAMGVALWLDRREIKRSIAAQAKLAVSLEKASKYADDIQAEFHKMREQVRESARMNRLLRSELAKHSLEIPILTPPLEQFPTPDKSLPTKAPRVPNGGHRLEGP